MTIDEPPRETIPADEVARLRRIEEAAEKLLVVMEGKRAPPRPCSPRSPSSGLR